MGAFKEWLEPQVRSAVRQMYKKGYATQSSGFDGEYFEMQMIDGFFTIDEKTKHELAGLGVEVLRGPDLGLPRNKYITALRFRATRPDLDDIKSRWDEVAALLPPKTLPDGIRPICDRAEDFRLEYAPDHPSFESEIERYYGEFLHKSMDAAPSQDH